MGGIFDGLGKAQANGKLPWLTDKFTGIVKIDKVEFKVTRVKGEPTVIVEFTVEATNDPVNHPVGCRRSWYQSMKNRDTGLGALKGFLYGVAGVQTNDTAGKAEVDAKAEELMEAAAGAGQILTNWRVGVQCSLIMTKGPPSMPFTLYAWSPAPKVEVAAAA